MRKWIWALMLLLPACTSAADRVLQRSPDFKAGYSDGCASVSLEGANRRESSFTRDADAYRTNPAYRRGWGEGFGACRQMASPQAMGPNSLPRAP